MLSKILFKKFSLKFATSNIRPFLSLRSVGRRSFSTETTKPTEESIKVDMEPEIIESNKVNMGFKAETKKLLDIVTHSLYTDKEIFLRELLSNCSDALEKQRYMEVTGQLPMIGESLFISITTNEKNKTITIFDTGVGMTRDEMIENLGTIAKSGTQNFLKAVKEKQQGESSSPESLIGQFGVGFYSSFIVGDTVEVISKPQNSSKAYHWVSDGNGEFQISDVENCDFKRGTKVIIHLKTDCRDFCRATELTKIVKKYSNFISYTIKINGEVINQQQAIWYREKKDISTEEYQKFFEVVANNTKLPYKYLLHFSSDVPLDIKALIYFPSVNNEKYGTPEEGIGLSLYSKKVLIKQKCPELLPHYLRFIKGVVDCSDIPLSISRETYQDSSLIFKLRVLLTKRIIKKLEDEMKLDNENYDKWYTEFSSFLREGVMSDVDNSEPLLRLLRFKSNFTEKAKLINLEDYAKKMKEGQEKVYYLTVVNENEIEENIFLENYKGKDLPILICTTPLDEVIFRQVGQYKNYKFLNIENETDDFLTQFKQDTSSSINKIPEDDITPYTLWIKNELEPYVSKVSISKRLKDSPILVTSNMSAQMKNLMAMMQMDKSMSQMKDFVVEINPSNEIITNLNTVRKEDPRVAALVIRQLFDSALYQSGIPFPHNEFGKRNLNLMKILLEAKLNSKEQVEVPVERVKEESLKDFKDEVKADIFDDFKLKKH